MREKPEITVITLTKDNHNELYESLFSIYSQDINCLIEILVIDGSQNIKYSIQLIDQLKKLFNSKTKILNYLNSDEKGIRGIYPSMNYALDNVRSDYLIFMNSGDSFYEKFSLRNLFKEIKKTNSVICFGQSLILSKNISWLSPSPFVKNIKIWCKFFEPIHQSMLVKSSVGRNFYFDTNSPIGADAKWKRDLLNNYSFTYLRMPVSNFSLNGISNKVSFELLKVKMKEPSRRFYEKIFEIIKFFLFKFFYLGPKFQKLKSNIIGMIF